MKLSWKATLLASTCLSASLSTEASAVPLFESTDFGNSLVTATLVTQLSTDFVQGFLSPQDLDDYLKWTGLAPGTPYVYSFSADIGINLPEVLNSSGSVLPGLTGNVPLDGILAFHTSYGIGSSVSETYRVTLSAQRASSVPEPASIALFGVGLAGIFALKRRKTPPKSQEPVA